MILLITVVDWDSCEHVMVLDSDPDLVKGLIDQFKRESQPWEGGKFRAWLAANRPEIKPVPYWELDTSGMYELCE